MEDIWKGTETTERDRLDIMDWTEVHLDCRAGIEEKSKLVAERSRETAEKTYKHGRGGSLNDPCFLHGREFFLSCSKLLLIQTPGLRENRRSRVNQEVMPDPVTRLRG